ncbi:RRM_XMAS2 and SAC3_GANP domain-containing protein xmas isoform X2 [Augochlora pura]
MMERGENTQDNVMSTEEALDTSVIRNNVFTFATPTSVSQPNLRSRPIHQSRTPEKQYKPKISRHTFKPAVNVFAQALKDTTMFEQLKKNSRSQSAKINPENSITCTNVPQSLLTKVTVKEYFMMFGNLLRVTIRPKKQIITVTYATKEEATLAYEQSGEYYGEKFNVEWTKLTSLPKSPTKRKDLQKNIVTNFLNDDDLQMELDAMKNLAYNVHDRDNIDYSNYILLKKKETQKTKGKLKTTARANEKAATKSEKHKIDSQISDLLPNASIEELRKIIRQPTHNSEDKYKVLEARDRLMRMKQTKSHTLAAAQAMVGVCPDMCPEKERLMRESKRQLAFYEQLEGNEYKINHAIAVKQYSRSSADQEEPMPHDLRPVKSLKMTMSYLLHEIANLCDEEGTNLGEWYHFLWDRTRGIRKDITQQELCCLDSVELVEQCARFHIVCSERLCAEEPSIFDKKINSDNLTKCLQTLKYMYHDLRVKGINCQNEPEFRAYIILLNLNNSNFMWDLQRLPKSVQRSPEVQFAQEVYSALESNNYYKFFKLVCKTTYLNACILLRYFNQVRLRALSVMVKAYCRTASTAYPLYELIDILGFEDEPEAVYFCEQVGLNVAKDEYHVLLNRQNFSMPVLNMKQNRACNVIESKRVVKQLSIGECIAGGKMPEKNYKYHKPHNSFDAHGYLRLDSVNAEDQSKNDVSTPKDPYEYTDDDTMEIKKSILVPEKNENEPESTGYSAEYGNIFTTTNATNNFNANIIQPQKINKNIFSISKSRVPATEAQEIQKSTNIFGLLPNRDNAVSKANKTNESSIFGNAFNATTTIAKSSNVFSKSLEPPPYSSSAVTFTITTNQYVFSDTTQENVFMKDVTSSSIFSNTFSNLQAAPTSSSATIDESNNKLKESSNFFTRPNQLEEIAKIENTKVADNVSVKRMQQIDVLAEKALSELQSEIIQSACITIVGEEFDKMNICNKLSDDIKDEILTEITHEICDSVLQEEIINSKKLHALSTKMKERTVTKYFNKWKFNTLKRRQQREQRKSLDNTPVWLQKYSSEECAKLLYSKNQDLVIENMCRKLEEPKITKSYVDSLYKIEVIIFMGIQENLKALGMNMLSNHYWKLIISWPDLLNKPVLWYHKKIMNQYLCPDDYTANPIMKIYQASPLKTLHICIRNFEGLISDHNLIGSDALLFIANASENANVIVKRLTRTILSRDRLMPIPLVVLMFVDENFDTQYTEVVTTLEKLLDAGYLSIYTIMYEKSLTEETILNITQTAMFWLSINNSPKNPLEMDYLENICHICLTDELWLRIQDDSSYNEKLLHALKEPKFIIDLHNEAVTHLMDIILDPESFMYTKFAPEFDKFIKNEHMMPCSYEYFDDSWKKEDYKVRIEEMLDSFKLPQWKYSWPLDDNNTFHQNVMSYYQEVFNVNSNEISCNLFNNLFFISGMLTVSNFIDILLHIIKRKVNLIDKDLKVVYNKNHIKYFQTLPWWFKSNTLNKYKVTTRELNMQKSEMKNKRKSDFSEPITKKQRVYRDENSDVELDPLAEFCEYTRSQVMEVFGISRKIEERLQAQQQQNNLFEERLKNALCSEMETT